MTNHKDEVLRLMANRRACYVTSSVEPAFYRLLVGFYDAACEWTDKTSVQTIEAIVAKFREMLAHWVRKLTDQAPTAMTWTYDTAEKCGLHDATEKWVADAIEEVHNRVLDCITRTTAVLINELHPDAPGHPRGMLVT